GIGEYTAAAVTAFAHHERAAVVDTNIRRVLARAVHGQELPAPSISAAERATAARVLPPERERSVARNQPGTELGTLVCTARCPLAARCAWVTAGRPEGAARSRRRQPFEGTDRQMRGMIMARLRRDGHATLTELLELDPGDPQRVRRCTASLAADGLARREGEVLQLP